MQLAWRSRSGHASPQLDCEKFHGHFYGTVVVSWAVMITGYSHQGHGGGNNFCAIYANRVSYIQHCLKDDAAYKATYAKIRPFIWFCDYEVEQLSPLAISAYIVDHDDKVLVVEITVPE
ncbi:hypothetical protein KI387_038728, partial [Taxus chinensis]